MKSFKQHLLEKRKNPEQNKKEYYYDVLEKYKDDPNVYITLTTENKVGINPHSFHNTPNGIYCYPLKSYWESQPSYIHKNKTSLIWDDIVRKSKYIFVLKSKCPLMDVSKYSNSDLKTDIKKIKRLYDSDYYTMLIAHSLADSISIGGREKKPYRKLINILNWIAYNKEPPRVTKAKMLSLGKGVFVYHNTQAQLLSNILRKLGYCGFVDNGSGIIHYEEPSQAYFLSKSDLTVLTKIDNKERRFTLPTYDETTRPDWKNFEIKYTSITDIKDIESLFNYRYRQSDNTMNNPNENISLTRSELDKLNKKDVLKLISLSSKNEHINDLKNNNILKDFIVDKFEKLSYNEILSMFQRFGVMPYELSDSSDGNVITKHFNTLYKRLKMSKTQIIRLNNKWVEYKMKYNKDTPIQSQLYIYSND